MAIDYSFEEFCFKGEWRNEAVSVRGRDLKRKIDGEIDSVESKCIWIWTCTHSGVICQESEKKLDLEMSLAFF